MEALMAGWIVSVTTVTHRKEYGRPTIMAKWTWPAIKAPTMFFDQARPEPLRVDEGIAGPCGTSVPCITGSLVRTARLLEDYARRWGSDPCGTGHAVRGRRGRRR